MKALRGNMFTGHDRITPIPPLKEGSDEFSTFDMKVLVTPHTEKILYGFFSGLSSEQSTSIDQIGDEIISNIPRYIRMADFRRPVRKAEVIFLKKTAHYSRDEQIVLKRALMAKLVLHLPTVVGELNLPPSIRALYPDATGRLADFLEGAGNEPYDSTGEFFCKDVRFVLGLSFPNGMMVNDINSYISLPTVILSVVRSKEVAGLIRYLRAGGAGPWARGHLDSRYLTQVNEQEYDRAFFRLAEVLERKKNIRGYVGTSWLNAPEVPEISPRLAFFRKYIREGGAFLLRHGTKRIDIENAIKTSETRRCLYQEGKYIPVSYSLLWPREGLIAWSKKNNHST